GFSCLPAHAGRALLRTMTTSFLCHSSRVGLTPLLTIPRKTPGRTRPPTERAGYWGCVSLWKAFITHFRPKSKRYGDQKRRTQEKVKAVRLAETGSVQSPVPGFGEKNFSNLPLTPSNSLASAGGSFLAVILGHCLANSALTLSHCSTPGSVSGLIASTGHSGSHTPQSMHSSG